jgi:3-(3-hydroxy-phenyl)propionate hydroxylase
MVRHTNNLPTDGGKMAETLPVVIAGAGPAGLASAVGLAQEGVPVIVLEREPQLAHDLRAGSFHPPTVEMLDRLGVGETMREIGLIVPVWQVRDRHAGVVAEFRLELLAGDTPYPFRLHCEQHKLTPVLLDRLRSLPGTECRFATSFVGAADRGDRVEVVAEGAGGRETIAASYLIGADGVRSLVRKGLGVEFEGFTWPERYLVASTPYDLAQHGFAMNAYIADPVEWAAVFKVPHEGPPGLWRLAFPIQPDTSDEAALDLGFVRDRLGGFLPALRDQDIPYHSIYRVHQRVAKTFRKGRVLLAGDAAHVNNPLGGMGLNSAVHDAVNMAEKLARIWRGTAGDPDYELDRYVRQRRTVNIEFVQEMSIRNKKLLEERDPAVRQERLKELGEVARDPERAYQHLLRTSMIASVRRAAAIE